MRIPKNFYWRGSNGKELIRVNWWVIAIGLLAIAFALFCLSGCAYSVIPTTDLNRAIEASDVIVDEGNKAEQRSLEYRQNGNMQAAAESKRLSLVGRYTSDNIQEPLSNSRDINKIGQGILETSIAVVESSPWGTAIAGISTILTTLVGGYALLKRRQANDSNQAHAWEESLVANPDVGNGVDTIDYGPKTKAKALADVSSGKLSIGAFKHIYPNG